MRRRRSEGGDGKESSVINFGTSVDPTEVARPHFFYRDSDRNKLLSSTTFGRHASITHFKVGPIFSGDP